MSGALSVDGLRVLDRLKRPTDDVMLELEACSVRDVLWALPGSPLP